MYQNDFDAVFTAATQATAWTSTNLGPRTHVSHDGYTWTVQLPAEGTGPARIVGRDGYGGAEVLDIPATAGQTVGIVEAAVSALRPADGVARPDGPVFRLQRWDAFDEAWEDRGTFKGERGRVNADFAVASERACDTGPIRLFKDGELVFADDPATHGLTVD
ncbi:hypothetical protein ACH5A7_20875 [Streptomyces sp. NPDC018955]|uniref:hypothetical protein n=1 Tax=Streptomyces sp. NPDC018955 TaxID=3365055 RepID=UPI0037AD1276